MKTKICTKCKQEKEFSKFSFNKQHKDGLKSVCKQCKNKEYQLNKKQIKLKRKKHYLKNSEKKKLYQNQYRLDNLSEIKIKKQEYADKNKIKIAEYQKEYLQTHKEERNKKSRKRYSEDINFKILINLRNRINAVLKGNSKSKSTLELLGCTIHALRKHLQNQFTRGMNWDNCGLDGWEIDHIKPCASFDLSDPTQQKQCFFYKNLQPLWGEDNRSKADKILGKHDTITQI